MVGFLKTYATTNSKKEICSHENKKIASIA